jgi:hypothetical protein
MLIKYSRNDMEGVTEAPTDDLDFVVNNIQDYYLNHGGKIKNAQKEFIEVEVRYPGQDYLYQLRVEASEIEMVQIMRRLHAA